MDMFDTYELRQFDPNGGVLVFTTHWRPRAGDPHPEQPGERSGHRHRTRGGRGRALGAVTDIPTTITKDSDDSPRLPRRGLLE